MSLKQHIPAIAEFYKRLKANEQQDIVQRHVIEILEHLHSNHDSFNIPLSMQTPFYGEFACIIKSQNINADTCFALLECLIIFCREKQLRHDLQHGLPQVEQSLLNFYESSELWNIEDETLLHKWYWHILPDVCNINH